MISALVVSGFYVFLDLLARFRHGGMELFFLLVGEIEVASKLLKFGGDMLAFCSS
jgi:hypothetical protein